MVDCECVYTNNKKLFKIKRNDRKGLKAEFYKRGKQNRYVICCIHPTGQYIACGCNDGSLLIIDITLCKYWSIAADFGYSCLQFSHSDESHLLVGTRTGPTHIIHIHTGVIIDKMIGHATPVKGISFISSHCLTHSAYEVIIWKTETYSKLYVLNLMGCAIVQQAFFIPVSNNILAFFNDGTLGVWELNELEQLLDLEHEDLENRTIVHVTFTKNGQVMMIACYPNILLEFTTNTWTLIQTMLLPETLISIKSIEFISSMTDGGSNKILAILTKKGDIFFYNVEENRVINALITDYPIIRSNYSPNIIVCVLSDGKVQIYDTLRFVVEKQNTQESKCKNVVFNTKQNYPFCPKISVRKRNRARQQIKELMDINKLRFILKQFGEYPDHYRITIWEELLQLPLNKSQYNAVINQRKIVSFPKLEKQYPLDKRMLRNLRILLDNLVTWCPFFVHVNYLPVFVFPFVKIFHRNPLICFEAVCTIIVNWCQFWFEYFPVPPMNILAIIENLLYEHDPALLNFLRQKKISPTIFAWSLLESSFSQNLSVGQWKKLWDHVLTNHPSFLLCAVAAFNIVQRSIILTMKEEKDFVFFYSNQYLVDMKKFIKKTYYIFENTSETFHPSQYINGFHKLENGYYPYFSQYPKTIMNHIDQSDNPCLKEMQQIQAKFVNEQIEQFLGEEKMRKIQKMAAKQESGNEQARKKKYDGKTCALVSQQTKQTDSGISKTIKERCENISVVQLNKFLDNIAEEFCDQEIGDNIEQADFQALSRYGAMISTIIRLEKALANEDIDNNLICKEQQRRVAEQIDKVKNMRDPKKYLELLNKITSLQALNKLIVGTEQRLNEIKDKKQVSLKEECILRNEAVKFIEQLNMINKMF